MRRFSYVALALTALLGVAASAFFPGAPRLVWNATASIPTGLYALRPVGQLQARELVVVRPPEPIASFLAEGGFLPRGVPLLKHVLAVAGQVVCRSGDAVTIDEVGVGAARDRDHLGRSLPRWNGCHRLTPTEVFLMNPTVADSLDGRYFGPLPVTSIVAQAVPIWTAAAGDGRFVWRAGAD